VDKVHEPGSTVILMLVNADFVVAADSRWSEPHDLFGNAPELYRL
jgi:hypothetical protein